MVNCSEIKLEIHCYNAREFCYLNWNVYFVKVLQFGSKNAILSKILVFGWMANLSCNLSGWNFLANLFKNGRTVLNWYIIRYLNLNFSAYFLGFMMANIVGDGTERWNTFQVRYFCTMRDFNVTRNLDWDFVAVSFNLNLALWSTSEERKRCMITFSVSWSLRWLGCTFVTTLVQIARGCSK